MGILFHPDPELRMVYWFIHGWLTAGELAAAQQESHALGDFSDWAAELIYAEPDAEFDPDIFTQYEPMRPLIRTTLDRMPARCAMVCSPTQMTSAPGFWITMGERVHQNRAYEPFTELAPAARWLGVPLEAVQAVLARLRTSSAPAPGDAPRKPDAPGRDMEGPGRA